MEDGDVTEPDEKFRILTRSNKVQTVGNSICASAASRGKNRADPWITQGIVDVFEPFFVSASKITDFAKYIPSKFYS